MDCEPRLKCAEWTKWCSAPYGIKEHVQIVEDVLPSPVDRQRVFWKTSDRVFRLGLFDTDVNSLKSSVGKFEAVGSHLKRKGEIFCVHLPYRISR